MSHLKLLLQDQPLWMTCCQGLLVLGVLAALGFGAGEFILRLIEMMANK